MMEISIPSVSICNNNKYTLSALLELLPLDDPGRDMIVDSL